MSPPIQQAIQSALQHHQAGRFQQAEALYRQVLSQEPENPFALHYLGLLAYQSNLHDDALQLMAKSLVRETKNPGFYSNYAEVCRAAGRTAEAIEACRRAITLKPDYADAHNNLAVSLLAERRFDEAVEAAQHAVRLNAKSPPAQNNLGMALAEFGKLREATEAFRTAATLRPEFTEAHFNLASALIKLDWHEQAVASLQRVCELNPNHRGAYSALAKELVKLDKPTEAIAAAEMVVKLQDDAPAQNMLGVALDAAGRHADAIAHWQRALEIDPNSSDAYNNLGIVAEREKHRDEAIAHWRKAVALKPDLVEAQANLANALASQKRYAEAIACCQEILRINPDYAQAHHNLGVALVKFGRLEEGILSLRRAIELKPDHRDAYVNLGGTLEKLAKFDDAITSYQRAISLKPDAPDAINNLAVLFQRICNYDRAEAFSRKAIEIDPKFAQAYLNLGNTLLDRQRIPEALEAFRRACELDPNEVAGLNNLCLTSNYSDQMQPEDVAREHFAYGERFDVLTKDALPHANSREPNRRLRIGYLSPDFRVHVVSFFIEPVLANHDHKAFEIICYASVEKPDLVTDRMKNLVDSWRDVFDVSDDDTAALIRRDGIDILVDLAGQTSGNRLPVMARKPAPVQASAFGYPNTTGLKTIDYLISDEASDPTGMTEHLYSESLYRLPNTFWVYQPDETCPKVSPPPSAASGRITFGSVNNFSKVTPTVMRTWARLLLEVPGSQLIVQAKSLIDPRTCEFARDTFADAGVDPARLSLQKWTSFADYLKLFESIDVALDPFPFTGGTTTCHTLWMGVPIVTLAGRSHVSRMGVSSLLNVGLPDLIASSVEEYVEIAARLAKDGSRLTELRQSLRQRMSDSPLCDGKRFTRHLEEAYHTMFQRWCDTAT